MLDKVKAFLKLESVQEALSEDNLEMVYTLWRKQGGEARYLTTFFGMNDIDILQYMEYIPEECYRKLSFKTLDLTDSNIKQIGMRAFEDNTSLTNVKLGDVHYIGTMAFCGCNSLTNVEITPSVRSIDGEAFSYCHIEELHIPKNVRVIALKAFSHNPTLTKVTTEHTMEEFKKVCLDIDLEYIFYCCMNLHKIICSDGEIEIEV